MKRIILLLLFLSAFTVKVFSGTFKLLGSQEVFHLTFEREALMLGGGAAVAGTGFTLKNILKINQDEFKGDLKAKNTIPMFDQIFMTSYSKGLEVTCDIARIGMLAAPVALFGFTLPKEEWFTIGTMYAESILWTYGLTEILKVCVGRARPYMYYDGAPSKAMENGDWNNSFPSGHTSMCFAAAAFSSYVYAMYNPDNNMKWVITGASFGLAATVGALRIAGGAHYFTDVFTGALIGTVSGFIIPWIHTIQPRPKKNRGLEAVVSPAGFYFTLRK